jgi:hypothetical protein
LSSTIYMDLSDPAVKSKLATLPEKMSNHAYEAMMTQARLIVALFQIYTTVETGSLRDTGRVERGGEGMHHRQISVRIGGYRINPKTGRIVDYAKHQEFGTRYIRGTLALTRATEEVKPTISDMIKHRVVEAVHRE